MRTNRYSVPVRLVGRRVEVRLTPMTVEVRHQGQVVTVHPRLHLKWGEHLLLNHYLELLRFRPGAFFGSAPLHQERMRGSFPPDYELFLHHLTDRLGERGAVKHKIEILMLHRTQPRQAVADAVARALARGVYDAKAVVQLLRSPSAPAEPIDVGGLARYDRPLPDTRSYDALLDDAGEVSP